MERNLFSFLKSRLLGGGGRNPSENKFTREEELQFKNSNFDSQYTKGGELYLNLNTIISNENHIGGGSKASLITKVQPYVQMKEVLDI